nr:N-lysine methyltransferase KMT5A-A-like isoform X2 [Nothobranchius furzeri]
MMAKRPKRVKMKPKDEAVQFLALGKDKDGFDVKFINSFKGRGVFSTCHFEKGSFLVEYRGEVINKLEYEDRLRIYHDAMKVFMFEFRHNGKLMCVDASREDDSLGRLVNDDHDIKPGEEITYDYGNSDWPWRLKVTSLTDAAKADEPLASKQDIQVTSLYDAANADEPLATLSSKQDTQVSSFLPL